MIFRRTRCRDSLCDDNDVCTGTETCDAVLDCQAGTPVVCDDGLYCNGTDTCNEATDSCDSTPDDEILALLQQGGSLEDMAAELIAGEAVVHLDDLDGRCFHLTNPDHHTMGNMMNIFADAGHAPRFRLLVLHNQRQQNPEPLLGDHQVPIVGFDMGVQAIVGDGRQTGRANHDRGVIPVAIAEIELALVRVDGLARPRCKEARLWAAVSSAGRHAQRVERARDLERTVFPLVGNDRVAGCILGD